MKKISSSAVMGLLLSCTVITPSAEIVKEAHEYIQDKHDKQIAQTLVAWIKQHIPSHNQRAFRVWIKNRMPLLADIAKNNARDYKDGSGSATDAEETGIFGNTDRYLNDIKGYELYHQALDPLDINPLSHIELGLADAKRYDEFMHIALAFIPELLKTTYTLPENSIDPILQHILFILSDVQVQDGYAAPDAAGRFISPKPDIKEDK